MAFFSIGIPMVAAIATLIHSGQGLLNLTKIDRSEPYPHFKKQKYFQGSIHQYNIPHPVFDRDYNYLGDEKY